MQFHAHHIYNFQKQNLYTVALVKISGFYRGFRFYMEPINSITLKMLNDFPLDHCPGYKMFDTYLSMC